MRTRRVLKRLSTVVRRWGHVLRDGVVVLVGLLVLGVGPHRGHSCQPQWAEGLFQVPGLEGDVAAVVVWDDGDGQALYAGGNFTLAGDTPIANLARWDGASWSPVGEGPDGPVYALAVYDDGSGPALFAGGEFDAVGALPANNIARWDGSGWSALAAGVDQRQVRTLIVHDPGEFEPSVLLAGGDDRTDRGEPTDAIVRWNGSAWSAFPGAFDGSVFTLAEFQTGDGAEVVAGGSFFSIDGTPARGVARYDGSAWRQIGAGLDSTVRGLAVFDEGSGPRLFAGGGFGRSGSIPMSNIARWTGAAWEEVGGGTSNTVTGLAAIDGPSGPVLAVGGDFFRVGGESSPKIALWTASGWVRPGNVELDAVDCFTVFDSGEGEELIAAGKLVRVGEVPTTGIGRWNGSRWAALGQGLDAEILALAAFDDGRGEALYATGLFLSAGESLARRIARFDGTRWEPLGEGFPAVDPREEGLALALFDDGRGAALYAGGFFRRAGDRQVNHVARWDGSGWEALGTGGDVGTDDFVRAMAVYDDGTGPALYATGNFAQAGSVDAEHVARWDGVAWTPVGEGLLRGGNAMVAFDDGTGPALYVGGTFLRTGSTGVRLVRWDGATWSEAPGGPEGDISALLVHDDGRGAALYAGGAFSSVGGQDIRGLARWNGIAWTSLAGPSGEGINGGVRAMAAFDDGRGLALYAAGTFRQADDRPMQRIARWDGSNWSSLEGVSGDGLDDIVSALAVTNTADGPALYAGGRFLMAGGVVSARLARWGCQPGPCPADLDADGELTIFDFLAFGNLFDLMDPAADFDGDGEFTIFDFLAFQNAFDLGCP